MINFKYCDVCEDRISMSKCAVCGLSLCAGCADSPEHAEHDTEEAEYLLIEGRDSNPAYQSNDLDEELADAQLSARQ